MDSETIAHHARLLWDGAVSDAARCALIKELERCADLRVNELYAHSKGGIPAGWFRRDAEARAQVGPIGVFLASMKGCANV